MDLIVHQNYGKNTPTRTQRKEPNAFKPRTVYVSGVPTRTEVDWALSLLSQGQGVVLQVIIGEAKLHPNDDFNKKIGRKIATDKSTNEMLQVSGIMVHKDGELLGIFENDKYILSIKYPKNKGPRFNELYRKSGYVESTPVALPVGDVNE